MKKFLLFILIISVRTAMAQQLPQFTQYIFNNYLLNPAVTGIENYTDLKMGHRNQWAGLDGAPVTSYLSVNTPIGRNFIEGDATSFSAMNGVNPSSRLYTQNYQAAEPHHGVGAMIYTDKAGQITQTNVAATYAYHLGLTSRMNLSVGVMGGFNRMTLNTQDITLTDPNDPAINNQQNSQWKPDVGAGVWLYSSNYFLGLSARQLLPQTYYFNTKQPNIGSPTVPHFYLTAGVKLFMTDEITFMPSVMIKRTSPVPLTYDVNGKFNFNDKFWIGGSYRHKDASAVLAGFNLSSLINVGYSYDITTSALNTVSRGSHEIVIGLMLNNGFKLTSPQHGF
jgi:type IX secretion system PorP/SprF family membrane protein